MLLEDSIGVTLGRRDGVVFEGAVRHTSRWLILFYFLMWVVVEWMCSLCGDLLRCIFIIPVFP